MIRVFITSALLFLLPFVLFAIYATVTDFLADAKDRDGSGAVKESAWSKIPLGWLTAISTVLVVGTLIFLALTGPEVGKPGGTYYPPTVKDGVVQPGYVE
ncbi:MAG: DUF6111 family protein [Pseudomonadota bacterium]